MNPKSQTSSAGPLLGPSRRAVRRAPLIGVAVALVAGIVAGRYAAMPLAFWACLGLGAVLTAAICLARPELHLLTQAATAVAIFAIGAARVSLSYSAIARDHVVTYTAGQPILATLRGRIVTSPVRFADTTALGYQRPDRTGFVLAAEELRVKDGWQDVSGLVRVAVHEPADQLAAGQEVELVGTIGRFRRPLNPGQFDRAAAARRNGVLVWMSVPAADGATVRFGVTRPWPLRMYWNLRAAARQHLAGLGSRQDGRLLNALIVGERHPALGQLNRAMIRAGIAHFLSISGLHLGVFLGFIYVLCRLFALSPRRSAIAVLAVLAGYVLLATPRVPLLRSALMAAALCAAAIARRRYSALNSLAAAAIVLLAVDPLQVFAPGFQLSFVIVCGLVILYQPVRRMLFGRWLRRRGLIVFRSDRSFGRWLHFSLGNWLTAGVTIATVAYVTAAPLVAYHFGLFSPCAIVLNVLLFPLVVAVLVPGYVSMALLWPMPGLSGAVGRLASAAANLLARAVEAIGKLPGLSLEVQPMPAGWVVLCYVALASLVFRRRLPMGRLVATVASVGLCAWTVACQLPSSAPAVAELHLLSVGAGQCALLRTPAGKTYVIDAGTTGPYDAYAQAIRPLLRTKRLPMPTAAFVSHANTDHFNALPGMIAAGKLRKVYLNDYFGREGSGPSLAESASQQFMASLLDGQVEVVRLRAGKTVTLDARTRVEVVWPPAQRRSDLGVNDTSLVLRVVCDDQVVLLPGDLDQLGQRELTARPKAISADVLVLPHHGGWETSLPGFFDAVRPKIVLVSARRDPLADAGPAYPLSGARGLFSRRLRAGCRYYVTSRDGWTCVSFGNGRVRVRTMRQQRASAD